MAATIIGLKSLALRQAFDNLSTICLLKTSLMHQVCRFQHLLSTYGTLACKANKTA